jgi:hypothetical protein
LSAGAVARAPRGSAATPGPAAATQARPGTTANVRGADPHSALCQKVRALNLNLRKQSLREPKSLIRKAQAGDWAAYQKVFAFYDDGLSNTSQAFLDEPKNVPTNVLSAARAELAYANILQNLLLKAKSLAGMNAEMNGSTADWISAQSTVIEYDAAQCGGTEEGSGKVVPGTTQQPGSSVAGSASIEQSSLNALKQVMKDVGTANVAAASAASAAEYLAVRSGTSVQAMSLTLLNSHLPTVIWVGATAEIRYRNTGRRTVGISFRDGHILTAVQPFPGQCNFGLVVTSLSDPIIVKDHLGGPGTFGSNVGSATPHCGVAGAPSSWLPVTAQPLASLAHLQRPSSDCRTTRSDNSVGVTCPFQGFG